MTNIQLRGTGAAIVTPFNKNGKIDFTALETITDRVIRDGIDYLVVFGARGDGGGLKINHKHMIVNAVYDVCRGRVPVLCCTAGDTIPDTLTFIEQLNDSPVSAILVSTPNYTNITQEGLYQYFGEIALLSKKPIVIRNSPCKANGCLTPATILRLAEDFMNIVATEETCDDIPRLLEIMSGKNKNFSLLVGKEYTALSMLAIGADGLISIAANCFTDEVTKMVNFALAGKLAKARQILMRMLPAFHLLHGEGELSGVSNFLEQMEICETHPQLPNIPVSENTSEKINHFLHLLSLTSHSSNPI